MYHRFDAIGDPEAELPRMSAKAQIQPDGDGNWMIVENGEVRAQARSHYGDFHWNRHVRGVYCQVPSNPLADTAWILLLQRISAV